jgi:hypothetical protein
MRRLNELERPFCVLKDARRSNGLPESHFQMLPVLRDHPAIRFESFAFDGQNEFRRNA